MTSIFDGYSDEDVDAMQDGMLFEARLRAIKEQKRRELKELLRRQHEALKPSEGKKGDEK
jgi:hypothetical protein